MANPGSTPAWTFADEGQLAAFIQSQVNEGHVVADIAGRIGYSATWVYRFARRRGILLKPGKPVSQAPSSQAQAVLRDFDERKDWSLDRIGRTHGISAERVRSIAERWGRLARRIERTSEILDFKEQVRQALDGAVSLQQVAERTGLSPAEVRTVAQTTLGIDAVALAEQNRHAQRQEQLSTQSERLRMAVEMAGLTHQQVAAALGVAPARATNIINGKVSGIETFKLSLAKVCGVDPRWLVEGIQAPLWLHAGMSEATLLAERQAMSARLREALDRLAGLTAPGQIAALAGITPAQLGQLAAGMSSPRRHLARLAEAFRLDEGWLRRGEPVPDWTAWLAAWRAAAAAEP